jgi:hypothetical protein
MTISAQLANQRPHARRLLLACLAAAVGLAAGCGSKPSPLTSAVKERAMGGGDAAKKMNDGMKLLMEWTQHPDTGFHFSYKAQKNINPNFPHQEKAKPEVAAVEMEADVTPEEISVSETQRGKKKNTSAKKSDALGWPLAQLQVTGTLLDPSLAMAFGSSVARSAGSEDVGGRPTDKYEFDTTTASASARAGFEMASAMLGGKIKFTSVQGTACVDKATGRLVKFNIDTELSDQAGNSWKEHQEGLVTAK